METEELSKAFDAITDAAHDNAYVCAINDAFAVLKEMGASSEMLVDFANKMQHMAEVRQATKFTLTK